MCRYKFKLTDMKLAYTAAAADSQNNTEAKVAHTAAASTNKQGSKQSVKDDLSSQLSNQIQSWSQFTRWRLARGRTTV